jgi:NAD(P)-dependent dehydrogenase (short-subunit alcohol dehydrogenase family)
MNKQKTIFITGASTGLGRATALLFLQKGWRVIATMRKPEDRKGLPEQENLTVMKMDVTDLGQINTTVAECLKAGPVDVVFNNAGYGLLGAMEAFGDADIVKQIDTNILGVIRVTNAFIPHFRANGGGMFLSTTSLGGHVGFPLNAIYNATKFAIEGWSEGLSFELAMHNISVKTIAPGAIATDFGGRSLDKRQHDGYQDMEEKLFAAIDGMVAVASSAEQIAEVVYEAVTDGKDQLHYMAGADAIAIMKRREEIGSEQFRKELGKQILG